MRVVVGEVGEDIGGLIVEDDTGPTLIVDPRLSRRDQVRIMASLLTDAEFLEVFSPFPELSLATVAYPREPLVMSR